MEIVICLAYVVQLVTASPDWIKSSDGYLPENKKIKSLGMLAYFGLISTMFSLVKYAEHYNCSSPAGQMQQSLSRVV